MSDTFQQNRKTTRLQNWNYSWEKLYFVTINTKFGESYFGEIVDNQIELSAIGYEVERQWLLTPSVRSDMNLILDEFVVMPNHFHGIIGIGKNEFNSSINKAKSTSDSTDSMLLSVRLDKESLPAYSAINPASRINQRGGTFGPQIKNLGSIIRGFKSSVTSWCKSQNILFEWHTRYHDIIISDETMLNKIRKYIRNNPKNWNTDRFRGNYEK